MEVVTMSKETQISAQISETTRKLMEKHVRRTGVKKGHFIELALRYHLRALHELPADILIPPRLVLTSRSFKDLVDRLQSPGEPTEELRRLLNEDGD